ncbi:hypothetical protein Dcar01_01534 [Deinococcus carri]|uniref:Uncharacterized protein n=1 Tax=Deinococcus carri TaxID=1211323 RepID=A0ABP9W8K6_9DEIO
MRKFWMTAALMTLAVASAQTITTSPKSGETGGPDAVATGTTTASVTQTVNLKLPQATALHLDATQLTFDISQLANQDGTWYCAYGKGNGTDVDSQLGTDFWNQTQTLPLGTKYIPDANTFGKVSIDGGAKVTSYPPVTQASAGAEVDNASKAYFVCYRSFIIQKFSNVGNFKLSVSRNTPTGANADMGRQMMYIQDNPCDTWGEGTGLYRLPVGATRELIPMRLTQGTTGARAAGNVTFTDKTVTSNATKFCRQNTSWLDDLVVIAVVVDGDKAGDNNAILTYTLESKASAFVIGDSDATTASKP